MARLVPSLQARKHRLLCEAGSPGTPQPGTPPSGSVLPLVGHTASISDVQSFPCVLTDTQTGLTVARRTVPPGAAQGAARARGPARFLLHAQHGVRLDTSGRRFQRSFFAAAAPCHSTGRARSGCHHWGQAAAWPAQEPHPSRADRRRQSVSVREMHARLLSPPSDFMDVSDSAMSGEREAGQAGCEAHLPPTHL